MKTYQYINTLVHFFQQLVHVLIIGCSAYLIISIVLSSFVIHADHTERTEDQVSIYLLSNGVHLDIVVPTSHPKRMWQEYLSIPENIKPNVHYISFGWGDQGFYLNTPEWSDLTLSTALSAVFLKGESAMHITYLGSMHESKNCRKILIPSTQYQDLLEYFDVYLFSSPENTTQLIPGAGYSYYDQFYESNGYYSLFFTCNTWTNNALKAAGQKACFWTPFDKPVINLYR